MNAARRGTQRIIPSRPSTFRYVTMACLGTLAMHRWMRPMHIAHCSWRYIIHMEAYCPRTFRRWHCLRTRHCSLLSSHRCQR